MKTLNDTESLTAPNETSDELDCPDLTGSLTDRMPGQLCSNCCHFEYGDKKNRIGGYRLGRCGYDKPILNDAPYNQFEDAGSNCPCWAENDEPDESL